MCWFDLGSPIGCYNLDLSRPYDRAVGCALLHLAANHKALSITDAVFHPPGSSGGGGGGGVAEPLTLVQALLPVRKDVEKEKQHIPLVAFASQQAAVNALSQVEEDDDFLSTAPRSVSLSHAI